MPIKRNKTEVLSISVSRELKNCMLKKEMARLQSVFEQAFKKLNLKTEDDIEKYFSLSKKL